MERLNLKELRPLVAINQEVNMLAIEKFQNEVLRPIIKFQHELIFATLDQQTHFRDLFKHQQTLTHKFNYTKQFITKNTELRGHFIGLIIGLLTTEEHQEYLKNKADINKRIIQIITQRIVDSFQ